MCRENVFLKIFAVVIPKEGLAVSAPQSSLWYDTDYRFVICSFNTSYCIVSVIPKELLAGPCPSTLLLVWQQQMSLKKHFFGTWLIWAPFLYHAPYLLQHLVWILGLKPSTGGSLKAAQQASESPNAVITTAVMADLPVLSAMLSRLFESSQ